MAKEQSEDGPKRECKVFYRPIRRNSGDDQLEKMAFQLQPNQVSEIFQVGDMHVMLQCVRHLPATPPNPQMLPAIQQRIEEQLRDQRVGQSANEIFCNTAKEERTDHGARQSRDGSQVSRVAGYLNREPIPMEQLAAECIMRHGRPILKGEINRVLLSSALTSATNRSLQADIDAEVARAADSMGYLKPDGTPDTDAWLKSILEEEGATIDLYIQDAVWPSVAPEKTGRRLFKSHKKICRRASKRTLVHRAEVLAIVLSNQRTAEDVCSKLARTSANNRSANWQRSTPSKPYREATLAKSQRCVVTVANPRSKKLPSILAPGEISGVIALNDQYVVLFTNKANESDCERLRCRST